jgi:hypothetical protein
MSRSANKRQEKPCLDYSQRAVWGIPHRPWLIVLNQKFLLAFRARPPRHENGFHWGGEYQFRVTVRAFNSAFFHSEIREIIPLLVRCFVLCFWHTSSMQIRALNSRAQTTGQAEQLRPEKRSPQF